MIKAIIFDFDGVLFDSEPLHFQACNEVFSKLDFSLSYDTYLQKYVGLSDTEMFPLILAGRGFNLTTNEITNLIHEKINCYQKIILQNENLSCIQGVLEFLKSAQKWTAQFAIYSGSTRQEIEAALSKLEQGYLKSYFSVIITKEDVNKGKPSPEGYLKTATQLQVLPQECLVIEDTPHGIESAKNAGMRVIALTTTQHASALMNAHAVVQSYADIHEWLINSVQTIP